MNDEIFQKYYKEGYIKGIVKKAELEKEGIGPAILAILPALKYIGGLLALTGAFTGMDYLANKMTSGRKTKNILNYSGLGALAGGAIGGLGGAAIPQLDEDPEKASKKRQANIIKGILAGGTLGGVGGYGLGQVS